MRKLPCYKEEEEEKKKKRTSLFRQISVPDFIIFNDPCISTCIVGH